MQHIITLIKQFETKHWHVSECFFFIRVLHLLAKYMHEAYKQVFTATMCKYEKEVLIIL